MPRGVYKRTAAHGEKISKALKGRTPKNLKEFLKAAHASPKKKGAENPSWKGDEVGYYALHAWVTRELGRPKKCSRCGSTKARRFEWSNISGEYKRDLADWIRLCVSCHRKEGFDRGEYVTWNKGLKVQSNTGRTHIKKGQHIGRKTEFKPGLVPHNKYLKKRKCLKCGREFQPRESRSSFCQRRCYWDSLIGEIPARMKIKET